MNSQPLKQTMSQMAQSLSTKDKNEILSILENEEHLPKRVKCVEIIINKFIPDISFDNLEQEVFSILIPSAKDLIDNIFNKNLELYGTHGSNAGSEIQQYIQMCLQLFEAISSILNLILSKGVCDISFIESVPLNVLQIISACFLHCNENNNKYHSVNLLTEILSVFKKAQEVHGKSLKILEIVEIDVLLENGKEYILSVVDSLCDIGETLSGMNLKSMTETWKSYVIFTNRFSNILAADINVARPLGFISSEIMKNLQSISNDMDNKIVGQTLKLSSFLLKVAIKFFDTFWDICRISQAETLDFFCTLYGYTNLYTKNFNKDHKESINHYIYNNLEYVLLKFFHLSWTEKLENLDLSINVVQVGFIIMISNVLPKLDIENNFGIIFYYLKLVFKSFEKGDVFLSENLKFEEDSIYAHLITSFASKILSVGGEEFFSIEEVLLVKVLCGDVHQSLLASDIWILTLRHSPPTISYDTIVNIMEKIRSSTVDPSAGYVMLGHVIRNLYSNLPNGLKVRVLDKYPPETQPDVWRLIGFRNLPAAKCFLKNVNVDNLSKSLDHLNMIRWNKKDVKNVTWMLEILSSLELSTENINKTKLTESLIKLWEFNIDSQNRLLNSQMFTNYLTLLCMATLKSISSFTNEQQIQVLKQLRSISRLSPNICIIISKITMMISKKSPNDHNINGIVSLLMKNLIDEHNPFLKLHISLPHDSLKNNWGAALDLNKDFDDGDFKNKKIRLDDFEESSIGNKYIDNIVCGPTIKYGGKIKTMLTTPSYLAHKKDADEDIQDILDQIKNDVKTLIKYSAQGKIKREDSKEIFSIITKLNQLV